MTMNPTKSDFIAVLKAAQDGHPLTTHQIGILHALQCEIEESPDATAAPAKIATPDTATLTMPEISLLPALLAKMTEACDLLREQRDMLRRKNPEPHMRDRGTPVWDTTHTSEATP